MAKDPLAYNPDDWKGSGDWDDLETPRDQQKRDRIKAAHQRRVDAGVKIKATHEWPQDEIDLMTRLWMEGKSATQISAAMGGKRTRNAIIGRVHRMGLERDEVFNRANQDDAIAQGQRRNRPVTPRGAPRRGLGWGKGHHHLFRNKPKPRKGVVAGRRQLPEELDRGDVLLFRPAHLLDEGFDTFGTGWNDPYAGFQMAA